MSPPLLQGQSISPLICAYFGVIRGHRGLISESPGESSYVTARSDLDHGPVSGIQDHPLPHWHGRDDDRYVVPRADAPTNCFGFKFQTETRCQNVVIASIAKYTFAAPIKNGCLLAKAAMTHRYATRSRSEFLPGVMPETSVPR